MNETKFCKNLFINLNCFFFLLQNITAKRSPNFYNITNSGGKVARFCLFKQAYRLGEDIVGTFDFEQTDVSCIEVLTYFITM